MIFLQMPRFDFEVSVPQTRRDKWLYFLKNLESFDEVPPMLREPMFEKAFDMAEYVKFSPVAQEVYQNDLKAYRDNRNVVETARIEGEAKGKAEGLAEGEAKIAEIARKMKLEGLPVAVIAKLTGLSASEIGG
jgi:predicted transposase/invertase (TIGR01784 family)